MDAAVLAHKIASEFVDRERRDKRPLGRNSLYNAVREAAIEVLAAEIPECDCRAYHLIDCPAHVSGAGKRTHLRHHEAV